MSAHLFDRVRRSSDSTRLCTAWIPLSLKNIPAAVQINSLGPSFRSELALAEGKQTAVRKITLANRPQSEIEAELKGISEGSGLVWRQVRYAPAILNLDFGSACAPAAAIIYRIWIHEVEFR
jgi:hypothetical protein